MQRKSFLTTVAGLAALAATGGAALGAATPRPFRRGDTASERNIARMRRRLERLIDQLQHDQRDYGGHRERALDHLQQARAELQAAEQYEQTHDRGTP